MVCDADMHVQRIDRVFDIFLCQDIEPEPFAHVCPDLSYDPIKTVLVFRKNVFKHSCVFRSQASWKLLLPFCSFDGADSAPDIGY